jgi:hypothetical protein
MIGKSLTSRVFLLVLAIILFIILWNYGVSSEIMIGAGILVAIRLVFVLTKLSDNNSGSEEVSD